jgi:putative oxidoreductase
MPRSTMKLQSAIARENTRLIHHGLCALRVCFGLSLVWFYGWSKLISAANHFLHGQDWKFISIVASLGFPLPAVFATMSTLVESVGGILLAAGLLTRISAGMLAFNMLVAVSLHVRAGQTPEPASLYLFWALATTVSGGGYYSLDAKLRSYRSRRAPETARMCNKDDVLEELHSAK